MLRYKFKRINEQTISENLLLYWRIRRLSSFDRRLCLRGREDDRGDG